MHKKNGFTLIELMITLAVIAIAIAFGLPQLNRVIHNNRIITELNTLSAHLAYARSEAVKRGVPVSMQAEPVHSENGATIIKTADWLNGYRVYIDTDGNGDANNEPGDALRIISGLNQANVTMTSPSTNDIVFNSDGTLADGSGEPLTLVDGDQIYTLDINPIGHVSINHTVSGE